MFVFYVMLYINKDRGSTNIHLQGKNEYKTLVIMIKKWAFIIQLKRNK